MGEDATSTRDALVDAGRNRLLTHGIEGLRAVLNASVLSREVPVARDTAYRAFRRGSDCGSVADAVVLAVAEAAHDLVWAGTAAAQEAAFDAFASSVNSGDEGATVVRNVMRATFEAQFRSPGLAAAWLLQAPALTASEAWEGDRPAGDRTELARRILALRRDFYRTIEEQIAGYFSLAVSQLGRRPRRGIDPRTIAMLMHCLLDGLVLHRLLDPDSISPELAAEAMYRLGLACTEAGPADDPRKPVDGHDHDLFDRLVEAAAALWASRQDVTVEAAATVAGADLEAALVLFPRVGDLADSLLRARVVTGGFADPGPLTDPARARQHLPALLAQLQRLRDLADALPHAVAAAKAHHPTKSQAFADDFAESESRVLRAVGVPRPERLARDLVEFAAQGSPGWPSVMALMSTTGYDTDGELPAATAHWIGGPARAAGCD